MLLNFQKVFPLERYIKNIRHLLFVNVIKTKRRSNQSDQKAKRSAIIDKQITLKEGRADLNPKPDDDPPVLLLSTAA